VGKGREVEEKERKLVKEAVSVKRTGEKREKKNWRGMSEVSKGSGRRQSEAEGRKPQELREICSAVLLWYEKERRGREIEDVSRGSSKGVEGGERRKRSVCLFVFRR